MAQSFMVVKARMIVAKEVEMGESVALLCKYTRLPWRYESGHRDGNSPREMERVSGSAEEKERKES